MPTVQLVVRSVSRDDLQDDVAIANHLVQLVHDGLTRGAGRAVGVVVRAKQIDLVRLDAVRAAGLPLNWFLAGLATTATDKGGEAEAVGIVGVVHRQRDDAGKPIPMANVFLEWPDNRWWLWRALISADGKRVREDTVQVRAAIDGDALPHGLGRWWSASRRRNANVKVNLTRTTPEPTVH